jgi:phytoene dehydrogenase-like protein
VRLRALVVEYPPFPKARRTSTQVHPLGAGSTFFSSLPLQDHGLEWIHSPAPLTHPLDDGTAVVLERNLVSARTSLGTDGNAWVKLMQPFAEHWSVFAPEVLRPAPALPKHPWLMARFGMNVLGAGPAM